MSEAAVYDRQGFGGRIGFGRRPALLVVDFVNGFNDPEMFGGGNIPEAIAQTRTLLAATRAHNLPVCFTRVVYAADGSDHGVFCMKAPSLAVLTEDAPASQVVADLAPARGEYVLTKTQPSAFFGTNLANWLISKSVDTVLVTGCTTSGCVRASVVDSMSYNFRTIVVTDCVGDRALGPHEANLFDMRQKYADLLTCAETIAALDAAKP
ncbi:MAG TPA: isochorismatase family protein [Beijerinckiaceae bacterium]|jgi:maleamate amidohydrolase